MKPHLEPWKTNLELWKTIQTSLITSGYRRLEGGSNHFSLQTNTNQQCRYSHLPGWQADEPGASTNLLWSKKRYVRTRGHKWLPLVQNRYMTNKGALPMRKCSFFVTHGGIQLRKTQLEKVLIFRPINFSSLTGGPNWPLGHSLRKCLVFVPYTFRHSRGVPTDLLDV